MELDWSSDVRRRIQERSYIQEQYVLTRCSLSSERSQQTHSHSQIHTSSNSESTGGVFLPDPHSSGSVLDTGSLPQGLEKMSPPEQRSSLSRWADSTWQQNLSETPDYGEEKVRLSGTKSPQSSFLCFCQQNLDGTWHEKIHPPPLQEKVWRQEMFSSVLWLKRLFFFFPLLCDKLRNNSGSNLL